MPDQTSSPSARILNVPNQLTALRLLLSVVVFVLIPLRFYFSATIVFVIAAATDWIDGYWARRYGQVTKVGRVFDPFVDKIIICGAFILLVAEPASGVAGWMAVMVVGREMLVTALRSFIEQSGGDFSAQMAGKLKMVLQCVAVAASLIVLWQSTSQPPPAWLTITRDLAVWAAVVSTVYSGIGYVMAAARYFR